MADETREDSMKRRGLTRVVVGVLSLGMTAVLVTTATEPAARSTAVATTGLLSASQCATNKAARVITYVSPVGFDASAGIIDVFAAQKLGYFADLCLKVDVVTNAADVNELVSSGRAQVTTEGSAAD